MTSNHADQELATREQIRRAASEVSYGPHSAGDPRKTPWIVTFVNGAMLPVSAQDETDARVQGQRWRNANLQYRNAAIRSVRPNV